jgi:hypothetical protein
MKELQEIREDILLLRNLGNIPKEVELVLLKKINSIEKQLALCNVVGQSEQLPGVEKHQCNCSNSKDRLDCGFECYNK